QGKAIVRLGILYLEASGLSAATSPFEFAALGDNIGLLVFVGTHAKVLDSLPGVALAAEQDGVRTSGRLEGELVKGHDLSTGIQDAFASRTSETESGDSEFGDSQQPVVISHRGNSDDNLLVQIRVRRGLLGNSGEGNGGLVNFREEEAAEDDLVELGIRTASEEAVKLYEEEQVRILALGGGPVALLDMVAVEVDTHFGWS
ncbi:hypothetical protein LNV47_24860, partial [Paucibacter sp. DJ4R-1]|nr:hypothetical protein [Paucibacter sp. DJ4R-1]